MIKFNVENRAYVQGRMITQEKMKEIQNNWRETSCITKTAKMSRVTRPTVYKYKFNNSLTIKGRPKNKSEKTNSFIYWFLIELINYEPCLYLKEVQSVILFSMGLNVSISTLCKHFQSLNLLKKRADIIAYYRKTPRVQFARQQWRNMIRELHPYTYVWLDECHFSNKDLQRKYGRSTEKNVKTYHHKVTRDSYSLLCCHGSEGVIYYEWHNTSGTAVNAIIFEEYLRNLLTRISYNQVLVLDNARIHKTETILALLENSNIPYIFLPPYSPDYSPIELLFNHIKSKSIF